MQFSISRTTLATAAGRHASIADRTGHNGPAGVLLAINGDILRLTSTGFAVALSTDHAILNATHGDPIVVDAAKLAEVTKSAAGDMMTARVQSGRLILLSGSVEYKLPVTPASDFPPVAAKPKAAKAASFTSAVLGRLIAESLFSVSSDDNRYGLNGVHVEAINEGDATAVRFITTDGSRLSWAQAPVSAMVNIPPKSLLSRRFLSAAGKLLGEATDWSLSISEKNAILSSTGLTLSGRLVEGEFPDYRQVLPAGFKRRAIVDTKSFSEALKNVRVIANDRNHLTRFTFDGDQITLSASDAEVGDVSVTVAAEVSGAKILTGFNLTYFQDIISATGAARLTLELGGELDPCIVRIVDRDDCLFVVMPMRLE